MSNYYFRDVHGNWFVSSRRNLTSVEDSASMEIAYMMGRLDAYGEILEDRKNDTLLANGAQVVKVDITSVSRG